MKPIAAGSTFSRIESIHIKNYRVLRDVSFVGLTPLSVFLGPNGSGKSTLFDVFAFLSESFGVGLRAAWDHRGRQKEIRSRGAYGPIQIELKYREKIGEPVITYHLSLGEKDGIPVVEQEWLQWRRGGTGKPFRFLDFKKGKGSVISGESPDAQDNRVREELESSDALAVSTLGRLSKHPRVVALRKFITGWYLSYLTAESARGLPEAGPQERLTQTGSNLPNVMQFLKERHPEKLKAILHTLSQRIPHLKGVASEQMADGRLLLQLKDAPFAKPILAKFASDGTLKMLSYLVVLHDVHHATLVGIEEPENHLHPRLLPGLAEECRAATAKSQLLVTTHSPFFINELRPEELWVFYRGKPGYTIATNVAKIRGVKEFTTEGAKLGQLWMQGFFGLGDPLTQSGMPIHISDSKK